MRDVLGSLLTQAGYQVSLAPNGPEGLELARKGGYAAALVDMMLPEMDGMTVLEELKRIDPELVVLDDHRLRLGGDGHRRDAEGRLRLRGQALQARGAAPRPGQRRSTSAGCRTRTGSCARRCRTRGGSWRSWARARGCSRSSSSSPRPPPRAPRSSWSERAEPARSWWPRPSTPTPPGTTEPFVVVNSGSLPHDLLESNLFGHVKGAFTGAVYAKKGLFELADTGTLFFDEIGNIPLETQAKLLRVMQEREFMRLGGVETIKVDVRVVAATNVDLERAVDERAVPGGSLLPAERDRAPAPSPAPAQGGHPGARPALHGQVRGGEREDGRGRGPRGACRPSWTTTGRATCASSRT